MNTATIRTLATAAILALVTLAGTGAHTALSAQQVESIPDSMRARVLPRQHLSGPRFGFTAFTGEVADLREQVGESVFMSQFGWQFETQIVSTTTGSQALMEWVILFGGFESDMRNLSVSWLAGYRLPNGFELGVGPNMGIQLTEGGGSTTSMVIAGGSTLPFGDIHVPMNVAMALAKGGPRITTLLGWIIG